ncbi:F0F1-type ATP synthase, epsilon subunit [Pelotomaculum thermopropionicum SI]|uniref:ATP synthase epsilon chain n=1 Tax=Pelotomaculum thermopropionicum (strain DSM 13744 / JCM 10971 / SI) TaxID=370438 RepID=ATPE_PELTS|nr:RecName: Full=ATP synthase epsilon chain; AltName: Full=ATP synthase F1 sector epsilon subunit; AltName: Full=F-ATPase epsilon subunit [Pelotomaculum thermopropionicum SI]BAF60992.1 F0F1-type ATP synthase, epsilon subunit [Pelotomaculum thermopropionicum SI]
MSDKTQRLEIVTPQRKVFSEDVSFLVAPGTEGELGVLPNHAPLITSLNIGIMRIQQEGKTFKVVVTGGFMEVRDNKVTVLANAAERAEEIDVARAEAARRRAEERLAKKTPDIDVLRAELALKRALTRLKAAGQ